MKITKSKLNQIIKEEVVKLLTENEDQKNAIKALELLSGNDPDYFAQALVLYIALKEDIEVNAPTENSDILAKLRVINQFAGSDIEDVDFLSGLSDLNVTEIINLYRCYSLQNVDGLQGLTNLTYLDLNTCRSLQNVDGLQGLTNLISLNLYLCKSLENADGLEGCTNLTTLDLTYCYSLQNVDGLQGLTNLTKLDLSGCYKLPRKLQTRFITDSIGTAHGKFMKALNTSKRNRP